MDGFTKDRINIYAVHTTQRFLFFAYLNNFSDVVNSNWNSEVVYSKMDPIYTYRNTTRKISLGFSVPSYTEVEAIYNFNLMNSLMDNLYPLYEERDPSCTNGNKPASESKGTAIILAPPLFRIKFKNLLLADDTAMDSKGLLGWIDSLTFSPDFESGVYISDENIYPKSFKINFNFNVMHEIFVGHTAVDRLYHNLPLDTEQGKAAVAEDREGEKIATGAEASANSTTSSPATGLQDASATTTAAGATSEDWRNDQSFNAFLDRQFSAKAAEGANISNEEKAYLYSRWKTANDQQKSTLKSDFRTDLLKDMQFFDDQPGNQVDGIKADQTTRKKRK